MAVEAVLLNLPITCYELQHSWRNFFYSCKIFTNVFPMCSMTLVKELVKENLAWILAASSAHQVTLSMKFRLTRIQNFMVIIVTWFSYFSFLLMSFKVLVEPVLSIPSCNRISVDPLSANDWEILVSCFRQHPEATWKLWTLMILLINFKEV